MSAASDTQFRRKLAIVSTFDRLCGIAYYTKSLTQQIGGHYDIDVLQLDTTLLRARDPDSQRQGDAHIQALAARLTQYEVVNVHVEHSMYGVGRDTIFRRLRWICEAAPALCLTIHWLVPPASISFDALLNAGLKFNFGEIDRIISSAGDYKKLGPEFYALIRSMQSRKPVSLIVHKKLDKITLERDFHLQNVFDHPLAFVSPEQARKVRNAARRDAFPHLRNLPPDAKIVGVFGFLTPYKGFETAIKAMKHTPGEFHLAIFGGLHPYASKPGESVNGYLKSLLDEVDATPGLGRHVHFCGSLPDEAFLAAMAICDVVVMPYVEIGLSSSGPMSQAIEMGARVIASRTTTFLDLAEYHPDRIEFFDIGNHLELAGRIAAAPEFSPHKAARDTNTNRQTYDAAFGVK